MFSPNHIPLSLWIRAARAPFFTTTLVPVFLAAAMGMHLVPNRVRNGASWLYFAMVIASTVLLHAATNLLNDYFDFTKGIDRQDTFGSSGVLTEGILEPRRMLIAGLGCLIAGSVFGVFLMAQRGGDLIWIGAAGVLIAALYSGKPFGLKYVGLGDIAVFLAMGPLLTAGAFIAQTGVFAKEIVCVSVPVGALVTAILHGNNMRDYRSDKQAHVTTFAGIIGLTLSKVWYLFLVGGAYAAVAVLCARGTLPGASLAVFASIPVALGNMSAVVKAHEGTLSGLADIDVRTAKLHLAFGILLIGSILLAGILGA